MTHVKAGQRRRAKTPKVRTGCRTCKSMILSNASYRYKSSSSTNSDPARRVKCDEGQPSCKRCITAGRKCQGYEPLPPTNPIRFVSLMPVTYPPNELRSFQHFRERTLSQLFTFFKEDIWTSHIIQTANLDHGIWHSVVALSSFHEQFIRSGHSGQPNHDRFALKQYNISIQTILGSERNSSNAHIHLISCILFICIEALRGQKLTVLQLLRTGYGILKEERLRSRKTLTESNGPSLHDRDLLFASANVFLSRIATQAFMLVKGVDTNLAGLVAEILDFEESAWKEKPTFHSLSQAHHAINTLRLDLERYDQSGVGMVPTKLRWWMSAFETFKKEYADQLTSRQSRKSIALMELQVRFVCVETSVFDSPPGVEEDPLKWDAHLDAFREMMVYAEVAVDLDSEEDDTYLSKDPQFHMHTGLGPVLYGIIHKCRDPTIRRQAISLMTRCPRLEGLWDSKAVLAVALRAMAVEERGVAVSSSAEIPATARVRRIAVVPVGSGHEGQTDGKDYIIRYEIGRSWAWEDANGLISKSLS